MDTKYQFRKIFKVKKGNGMVFNIEPRAALAADAATMCQSSFCGLLPVCKGISRAD
jgi:hypothetical protein